MSLGLRQVINDCKVKQDWYREYLIAEGAEPLAFVGRFSQRDSEDDVASDIRRTLGLNDLEGRTRADSWSSYLRLLTERAEDAGITVVRSGIVGNNTHWALAVEEFRGFAIPDRYAPLVFVNAKDWIVSQIFTLIHEVAHIWLAEEGVSNVEFRTPSTTWRERNLEKFCNAVAAEVLVPAKELKSAWAGNDIPTLLSRMSTRFRVSEVVVLLRARDLGFVSVEQFDQERAKLDAKEPTAKGKGGNFFNTFPLRNGRELSSAVLASALNGRLLYHEAARMLGVRVPTLFNMAQEYGLR
jgi:Zn-dependent peptidase ImmA (M78 family)